jgi:hypothetical protein
VPYYLKRRKFSLSSPSLLYCSLVAISSLLLLLFFIVRRPGHVSKRTRTRKRRYRGKRRDVPSESLNFELPERVLSVENLYSCEKGLALHALGVHSLAIFAAHVH